MSKSTYTEVLKGDFKALGYYVDQLLNAKSDFDFFYGIAVHVVPLVQQTSTFEHFYFRYIKEKDAHLQLRAKCEAKAQVEIEQAFVALTTDLTAIADFKQQLDDIGQVFNWKSTYAIPSYIEVAYGMLGRLLENILEAGKIDIVQKYATIIYHHVAKYNADTSTLEGMKRPYIDRLMFASSLIKLQELDDIWRWKCVQHSWVAWEYLALVEWCWNTPFSFFQGRDMQYGDYQSRNISIHLLSLHDYWLQVDKIKNRCTDRDRVGGLFCREVFAEFLKVILNEVILEQEINSVQPHSDVAKEEGIWPYRVELRLDYTQLLVDVQWFHEDITHTYEVCTVKNGSGTFEFITASFAAPMQQLVDIKKVTGVSGGTVAKYFERLGLNNVLGKLFFGTRKTYKVAMKTRSINGSDLSKDDLIALRALIKSLKESRRGLL